MGSQQHPAATNTHRHGHFTLGVANLLKMHLRATHLGYPLLRAQATPILILSLHFELQSCEVCDFLLRHDNTGTLATS